MSITNEIETIVRPAIDAANEVDRSQVGHHSALMTMLSECAKSDNYLSVLSAYCTNRVQNSKQSLCTAATFAWLSKHFGVRIHEGGEVTRGREFQGKGFTSATFEAARLQPWYKLAKEMAFKVPTTIAINQAAASAVKMREAGKLAALPTMEELYAEFTKAVGEYESGEAFAKWKAELVKQAA